MNEVPSYNPDSEFRVPEVIAARPTYNLEMFVSFHGTGEDFAKIDEEFAKADVVVPEIVWTVGDLNELAEIADGSRTPEDDGSAYGHFKQLLFNSGKPVMVIDVSREHGAFDKHLKSETAYSEAIQLFIAGQFDDALQRYESGVQLSTESAMEREQHMAERLRVMLPQLQDRFPELRSKDAINILMPLGATHTTLVHDLSKSEIPNLTTKMVLGDSPLVFNYNQQLERELKLGRTPDNDLAAKALLGAFIDSKIREFVPDTNQVNKVMRQLGDVVSVQEIKSFSEQLGHITDNGDVHKVITNKVIEWIDRSQK